MSETQLAHVAEGSKALWLRLEALLTRDSVAAAVLGLFVLITRLPFGTQVLYHWDSVNFAFALRQFDLAKEQPQPPGYILYVLLVRLVNSLIHDPNTAMVAVSITASVLAAPALYMLGKSMFGARVGWVAAILLIDSPLFWFYGEIALPHTLDALLTILVAWWFYETMRGNYRFFMPAVAAAAAAGGIRQQTPIFLAGLILFSLRKAGWRRWLMGAGIGAALCLAWFGPMIDLSGGLGNYLKIMSSFSDRFQATTSVFLGAGLDGIRHNLGKLVPYTLYGCGFSLLGFIPLLSPRGRAAFAAEGSEKWLFLGLWAVVPLGFYIFVHMGQQGLVFVYLPALLLAGAFGLVHLFKFNDRGLVAGLSLITIFSVVFFLFTPEYPLGKQSQRLLTRATLANTDRYFQERLAVIKHSFNPASTVILAANWHHLDYYLPGWERLRFSVGKGGEVDEEVLQTITGDTFHGKAAQLGLRPDSQGKIYLVVFDSTLDAFNASPDKVEKAWLPDGEYIAYFVLSPQDMVELSATSFGLQRSTTP
jgi:hypothetical protein